VPQRGSRSPRQGIIARSKSKKEMALISQITQMNSVRAAQPICAICGISAICVSF
jgi:hypothetical protein